MTEDRLPPRSTDEMARQSLALLSTTRPNPARIYDAWLGGKDNFLVDRRVAERVAEAAPFVVAGARANRAFLRRAVAHLARAGIGQFLDLGAGLPSAGNVHEIAQRINPDARVVYVDNDPVVLAHGRALLACDPHTVVLAGDIREPASILTDPALREHLDLGRPLAVLLVAVLHFITEAENPSRIVAAFRDALPAGSYLVLSHVAHLADPYDRDVGQPGDRVGATQRAAAMYEDLVGPFVLRTPSEIEALFIGFNLVSPGLVPASRWRRRRVDDHLPIQAGMGRLSQGVRNSAIVRDP